MLAMDVQKISDLKETPAPTGQSWWEVDGVRYIWRQGSPYVRATVYMGTGAVPDDILPLDTPTKAAAKRAVFKDVKG